MSLALNEAKIDEILVVVGYQKNVFARNSRAKCEICGTKRTFGNRTRVMCCREFLEGFDGPVFIIAGDNPMLQSSSVERLFEEYERARLMRAWHGL